MIRFDETHRTFFNIMLSQQKLPFGMQEVLHYGENNSKYVQSYDEHSAALNLTRVIWLEPAQAVWEAIRLKTGEAKHFMSEIGMVRLSNQTDKKNNVYRFEDYLKDNIVYLDLFPVSLIVIESPDNAEEVIEGFGEKVWNDYPHLKKVIVQLRDLDKKLTIEDYGFQKTTIIGIVEKASSPKWVLYERV